VVFLAVVLLTLSRVLREASKLVSGVTEHTVPLLDEVTSLVTTSNAQLGKVDAITTNVQTITTNATALSSTVTATVGGPLVKAAAFSYGVRKALSDRRHADVEKRVRAEMKAAKRRRKD
jgi:hypothetical protein